MKSRCSVTRLLSQKPKPRKGTADTSPARTSCERVGGAVACAWLATTAANWGLCAAAAWNSALARRGGEGAAGAVVECRILAPTQQAVAIQVGSREHRLLWRLVAARRRTRGAQQRSLRVVRERWKRGPKAPHTPRSREGPHVPPATRAAWASALAPVPPPCRRGSARGAPQSQRRPAWLHLCCCLSTPNLARCSGRAACRATRRGGADPMRGAASVVPGVTAAAGASQMQAECVVVQFTGFTSGCSHNQRAGRRRCGAFVGRKRAEEEK